MRVVHVGRVRMGMFHRPMRMWFIRRILRSMPMLMVSIADVWMFVAQRLVNVFILVAADASAYSIAVRFIFIWR